MRNKKNGFTLIEMLVVIAIIAILVAIVIPVVGDATTKAKAATDAANLRAVYAELNINVINGDMEVDDVLMVVSNPTGHMDKDSVIRAVFDTPGFIQVYYVNVSTGTYYGFDYLSELALNGPNSAKLDEIGTGFPAVTGTWYQAGVEGSITP